MDADDRLVRSMERIDRHLAGILVLLIVIVVLLIVIAVELA